MAVVKELFRRPVAGFQGEFVDSLRYTETGVEGDRVFTLVDELQLQEFLKTPTYIPLRLTQVLAPELVLFRATDDKGHLALSYKKPGLPKNTFRTNTPIELNEARLPFAESIHPEVELAELLANYTIPLRVSRRSQSQRWAEDCGDDIANWVSKRLKRNVRLMKAVANEKSAKHHFTWYTDLHLITWASLRALVKQSNVKSVDKNTFRPNIIAMGTKAFEEELWETMLLAGVPAIVKECERCGYVGIKQETGERAVYNQVLDTISKEHDLNFGVYLTPSKPMTVRVGDELVVTSRRKANQATEES
jgi:uncharacterized protein YcbX